MKTGLRALLFVLAVPLLASALASDARDRWDERWSRGLQREFRAHGIPANNRALSRYTLATLCADPRRAARTPPCRTYNRLSTTMMVGAGTAAAGLFLLGGVSAVGALARRRRAVLVLGLRPVVYGVSVGVVLLLIAHGWLGVRLVSMSGLLFGAGASLTLTLGAAAVLVVGLAAGGAVRLARRVMAPPAILARVVAAGRGTPLGDTMARLSHAHGVGDTTRVAVAGIAPAVFVSGSGASTLDGRHREPVLHVSLSLARILSVAEFEALLAAQVFQLGRGDGLREARFWDAWARLQEERARLAGAGGLRLLVSFPVMWLLTFLTEAYREGVARSWDERETASDAAAARVAGGREYGVALLKMAAFSAAWPAALRAMAEAAADGEQYLNASQLFAETAAASASRQHILARLGEGPLPLRPRLERLGLDPESLIEPALDLRPVPRAIDLIEGATAIEEELTTGRHLQLRASRAV